MREKDTSLSANQDGYTAGENEFGLHFASVVTDGVTLTAFGRKLLMKPLGADESADEAEADEKKVEYASVFGSGTTLRYTPTLSGVKEDIILASYTGRNSFSFGLNTDGLGLFVDGEGKAYFAEDEKSAERVYPGDVILYDADNRPGDGELAVETVEENEYYILTVVADKSFLEDPDTVYPVTIDPSLIVSDNAIYENAVEDTIVFSNRTDSNYGNYKYLTIGYCDDTYKIGRVLMRLPGLYNHIDYISLTSSQIVSAELHMRDSSGHAAQNVGLYRNTSGAWTESGVTWNTKPVYYNNAICSVSMSSGEWTSFDITTLAKGWKTGSYNASLGFTLINEDEAEQSKKKAPFSSEYTANTGYRPYVSMTYSTSVTLSTTNAIVIEGFTKTLTASSNPSGATFTWSSGNTAVATVNQSGVITGVKAGRTVVTAAYTDSLGNTFSASCFVCVSIPIGVYRFTSTYSSKCLSVYNNGITGIVNAVQRSTQSSGISYLSQLWKIGYLGDGYFSIRPMHKLDKGLDVTGNNADVYSIGTADTLTGVLNCAKWTIDRSGSSVVFTNSGMALQLETASTGENANICVRTFDNNPLQLWTIQRQISPPSGAMLYENGTAVSLNSENRALVGETSMKYVAPGQIKPMGGFSVETALYSGTSISQSGIVWTASNGNVAVNSSMGNVTGVSPGTVTVTGTITRNSVIYIFRVNITVTAIANGTYFLENRKTEKYVDIEDQAMSSGTRIHQWDFHGGNSQRWVFTLQTDGYYTIKSANSTMSYYLGVAGDSTANDVSVVLSTGSLTNGMKWKISVTSSGAYKITPKTGEANNRVLAVGWYLASINGIDIQQRDYANDTDYYDEWVLFKTFADYFNMYIGVTDGDSAMPGISEEVGSAFEGNGYNGNSCNYCNKAELVYWLKNSEYFSCITHGNQDRIRLTGNVLFTINDIDGISDSDLENLKFVYYGACLTGEGGAGATNLVNATYNKGVDVVLGFMISVNVYETNLWTTIFMENIANGSNINNSMQTADAVTNNDNIIIDMIETQNFVRTTTSEYRYLCGSVNYIPCP